MATYASMDQNQDFVEKLNAVDAIALKINDEFLGSKENRRLFPKFAVAYADFYKQWVPYRKRSREAAKAAIRQTTLDSMLEQIDRYMDEVVVYEKRWKVLRDSIPQARRMEARAKAKKAKTLSVEVKKKNVGAIAAAVAVGLGLFLFTRKK